MYCRVGYFHKTAVQSQRTPKIKIIVGFLSAAEINTQNYHVEGQQTGILPLFWSASQTLSMDLSSYIIISTQSIKKALWIVEFT